MAQPTITKAFSNGTAFLGGAARTLTITVANPNPVAIGNFSIIDNFPTLGAGGAIIQVANPPVATSTCTGASVPAIFSPNAGDVSVSASGGTLAANGSCTLTVAIEGRHTNGLYTTGTWPNTINAVTGFGNDIGIRAQANASASIAVTSPLGVAKAFSPASLASGQPGSVTITLSNAGTTPLNIVGFDDLPIDGVANADGSKGLLVTGTATTCAGGATSVLQSGGIDRGVRLTGGTIPAGGSCTVTASFTATTQAGNTPVTYTNTIPAGAVDVGNPRSSARTAATLLVADTLRVLKANNGSTPRPGAPVPLRRHRAELDECRDEQRPHPRCPREWHDLPDRHHRRPRLHAHTVGHGLRRLDDIERHRRCQRQRRDRHGAGAHQRQHAGFLQRELLRHGRHRRDQRRFDGEQSSRRPGLHG
jgi:hypothetical protein